MGNSLSIASTFSSINSAIVGCISEGPVRNIKKTIKAAHKTEIAAKEIPIMRAVFEFFGLSAANFLSFSSFMTFCLACFFCCFGACVSPDIGLSIHARQGI